ncbi:MAG: methylated-DNA--[protein]-cysteine S-methyltransferase [Thermoplasmata archaeon]
MAMERAERPSTAEDEASTPVAPQPVPDAGGASLAFKVVLLTRSPGLLQTLTARCQNLVVDAYLLGPHLVLQAFGTEEDLNEAQGALGNLGSRLSTVLAPGQVTFVLEGGETEEEVIRLLAERAAHVFPPIRWAKGEARVTVLVGEAANLQEVQALFPDARLLSKRAVTNGSAVREALGSPLFLPNLTKKQARALQAAFDAGYYELPRRVTMDEVSPALNITRSTFQEHLHRAERHLVRAMLPLIRIRASESDDASPGPAGEALALYSRFSQELGLYVQLELFGGRVRRVRLASERGEEGEDSHPYLTRILEHIRTGEGDLNDIPVDLQVGPFDREVLAFLRTLRPGVTMTYSEIARRLGHPKAARAVGNACRRNPVPVIIPCHRVVPATGGLGGYGGGSGAPTKRALLEREGADVSSLVS